MSRRTSEASKAVREAWENERQLVLEGKGTRDWTQEQQQSIIDNGKAYDDIGKAFEGHHMKSAEAHPEYQGDAKNIQFLSRTEHQDAHGGSFQNPTNGYYNPITKETVEFDQKDYKPCEVIDLSNPISKSSSIVQESTDKDGTSEKTIVEKTNVTEKQHVLQQQESRVVAAPVSPSIPKSSFISSIKDGVRNAVKKTTEFAAEHPVLTTVVLTGATYLGKEIVDGALKSGSTSGDSSSRSHYSDRFFSRNDLINHDDGSQENDELLADDVDNTSDNTEEKEHSTKRPHDTRGYERTRFGKVEHVSGYSTGKNKEGQSDE